MKNFFWSVFLFLLLTASPAPAAVDNTAPVSPVKLVFIHHSTGGNWLGDANDDQPWGGLGTALKNNNYYVSATNYGWGPGGIGDSSDIPSWPNWFTGPDSAEVLSALYNESDRNFGDFGSWSRLATDPGGENQIVLFKSCFPNSDLYGDPDDEAAEAVDDQFTVSNAKAVYNLLLSYFQTRHGINDFGTTAYGGPCPPSGTHRYEFNIYALDTTLNLGSGASKSEVVRAMSGHVLSQGRLTGTYGN